MSILLIALLCTVLPKIVAATHCAAKPWIGSGAEVVATNTDDITCYDYKYDFDCARYIEAQSTSADCYSKVRLAGSYSLLGYVSCNPTPGNGNCTIITTGDVVVGCCGSYQAYEYFNGGYLSKIVIGSNSKVSLAKLELEPFTSFTVGENTTMVDVDQTSSIAVREYSQLTINSSTTAQFFLSHSVIELKDFSDLHFEATAMTFITNSTISIAELSNVVIKPHRGGSFHQLTINSIGSIVNIDDISIFQWANINLDLYNSFIFWFGNSSVNIASTDVSMASKSQWTIASSTVILRNVTVQFGNDSTLLLRRCIVTAANTGISYRISIGHNSSLVISSNTTQRLRCNLLADLVIPNNVKYTEADVSDMLSCNTSAAEDTEVEFGGSNINETSDVVQRGLRMERASTHTKTCPIGMTTTITTKRPTATSKPSTSPTTKSTSSTPKTTTSAGIKVSGSFYLRSMMGLTIALLLMQLAE